MDGDGETPDLSAAVRRVIQGWYAQGRNYDFTRQGYGSEVGNEFTQLVWKGTSRMGVGVGIGQAEGKHRLYVTILYSPPGNRKGMFGRNVEPAY